MRWNHWKSYCLLLVGVMASGLGCRPQQPFYISHGNGVRHYIDKATEIEYPDVTIPSLDEVSRGKAPLTIDNPKPELPPFELSLEQAVQYGLANSTVIRSLTGVAYSAAGTSGVPSQLMSYGANATTIYNPAMIEAGASGIEAALSSFDAQYQASLLGGKSKYPNNVQGIWDELHPEVQDTDTVNFSNGITKNNATGGQTSITTEVDYSWSNATSRKWPSAYFTSLELGYRQPLLRGAGVDINRIAGPTSTTFRSGAGPYSLGGVILARINTDIQLVDFEKSVRDYVADVEKGYWNLYFAYRNLEASLTGRDASLQTWRQVYARFAERAKGGAAQDEAQARQQYWQFDASVTQAQSSLYRSERNLRYIIGLTATDGRLICPTDKPGSAKVEFDWFDSLAEAIVRSPELRKQKWEVKRAEYQLIAAKNFVLPNLDFIGTYNFYGMGAGLLDDENSAFDSLLSHDLEGFTAGLQYSQTFGFRKELASVRYQQLTLVHLRKIYQEMELELQHQLAGAFDDLVTNYTLAMKNYQRTNAARAEVTALNAAYNHGSTTLDVLLLAQRRLAEAEIEYYRNLVDYNLSIMEIHRRKNSLLEYNGVHLAEGAWPEKAYFDALRRAQSRAAGRVINYGFTRPDVISRGAVLQETGSVNTDTTPRSPTPAGGSQRTPEATPSLPAVPSLPAPSIPNLQNPEAVLPPPATTAPPVLNAPVVPSNGTGPESADPLSVSTGFPGGYQTASVPARATLEQSRAPVFDLGSVGLNSQPAGYR